MRFFMFFFQLLFSILKDLHLYIFQFFKSIFLYIKNKSWNRPSFVGCIDYFGSYNDKVFGSGKTLSAVKLISDYYFKYNGKVFINENGEQVTNNVKIYSNIDLSLPFTSLQSLKQLDDFTQEKAPGDVGIFLVDECNAVLNSRNFRNNLTPDVIQSIVTCRHNNIYMVLVGQRFNYLDALCRDMVDNVIECSYSPLFHCLTHRFYKGFEIQQDKKTLHRINAQYVFDRYFSLYDSFGAVQSLTNDDSYQDKVVTSSGSTNIYLSKKGLKNKYKKVV